MSVLDRSYVEESFKQSIKVLTEITENEKIIDIVVNASEAVCTAYRNNKKTLFAGNGGSAADAQHFAAEFVSRFNFDRPGLPAIALSTDTSIITAIGNDYGYEKIFSRQIQASAIEGDVMFAFSTSGTSKNILEALRECKKKKVTTIGFTGKNNQAMIQDCDYCISVPSSVTSIIQECHGLLGHIICSYVEKTIFGDDK